MRSQAYAYPLGVVAILAGLAVLAVSASRVIDNFGDWSWPMVSGYGIGGRGHDAEDVHRGAAHNRADWAWRPVHRGWRPARCDPAVTSCAPHPIYSRRDPTEERHTP
jgi:hypothetical protein